MSNETLADHAAPAASVPAAIGKFKILGLLGEGGMGRVYRAFDPALQREVAIKQIKAAGHDPEFLARFQREARLLARVEHASFVGIQELLVDGDQATIVMELVEGRDPSEVVRTPRQAIAIATKIALALQHAHEKGIVHRDLKPGNVLVDEQGNVKILDLGLAKALDEDQKLTRTGDIMGSPAYMAPEQAFGAPAEVDHRADVYALGALLYELLTGEPPLLGPTILATLRLLEAEEPRPPSELAPDVSPALDALVLQALAKRPEERFADMLEFARALARVNDAQATARLSEGPQRAPARPAPRRQRPEPEAPAARAPLPPAAWIAIAAACALLGVLLGRSGSASPAEPQTAQDASAERADPPRRVQPSRAPQRVQPSRAPQRVQPSRAQQPGEAPGVAQPSRPPDALQRGLEAPSPADAPLPSSAAAPRTPLEALDRTSSRAEFLRAFAPGWRERAGTSDPAALAEMEQVLAHVRAAPAITVPRALMQREHVYCKAGQGFPPFVQRRAQLADLPASGRVRDVRACGGLWWGGFPAQEATEVHLGQSELSLRLEARRLTLLRAGAEVESQPLAWPDHGAMFLIEALPDDQGGLQVMICSYGELRDVRATPAFQAGLREPVYDFELRGRRPDSLCELPRR